jgi:hypothetical protein
LPDSSQIVRFPERVGAAYLQSLDPNLEQPDEQQAGKMLAALPSGAAIHISASPLLITYTAGLNGAAHIFLFNIRGLRGGQNAVPMPESGMTVTVPAAPAMRMYYVPFLGQKQEVRPEHNGSQLIFHVPSIERGGILWLNPALEHGPKNFWLGAAFAARSLSTRPWPSVRATPAGFNVRLAR